MPLPLPSVVVPLVASNLNIDVEQTRRMAIRARALLKRLQPMKFQSVGPGRHPDERLVRQSPGPRGPAIGEAAIDLELDLTFVLWNSLNDLVDQDVVPCPPRDLGGCLTWVYNWAPQVVDHHGLLVAVESVVTRLSDFVEDRPDSTEVWETANAIVYRFSRLGIKINAGQLRTWSARGNVSSVKEGNRNLYSFRDVLGYLNQRIEI